jgi:hypothetical protein
MQTFSGSSGGYYPLLTVPPFPDPVWYEVRLEYTGPGTSFGEIVINQVSVADVIPRNIVINSAVHKKTLTRHFLVNPGDEIGLYVFVYVGNPGSWSARVSGYRCPEEI